MVREDNLDGRVRSGTNWRRMDISIDHPFSQLPAEDVVCFPYAVLEVKLQTQLGQRPPEWVRQLISSHLVEAVPKFSKFIHGTACLFPNRINLLPFWMPQMNTDIRKPIARDFGIQRPGLSGTTTTSDDEDEDLDSDSDNHENSRPAFNGGPESRGLPLVPTDTEGQAVDILTTDQDYPIYDSDDDYDENYELEEARKIGGLHYLTLAWAKLHALSAIAARQLKNVVPAPRSSYIQPSERQQLLLGGGSIQQKKLKAPHGKKIYVPVCVEPKVYFAAERTFLGWLEYSIYIGTIATTPLNFGSHPTALSFWIASIFTLFAILSLCYSVGIYLYRSRSIRRRKAAKHYDRWGPSVLCGALFVAVGLNFALEGRNRGIW